MRFIQLLGGAGYIITWGSNVPQTRTPDAHFLTEVRYKGTKVVSIAPDYAESTAVADTWISLKTGSDSALAMAMGHVILREYYWGEPAEFFVEYSRKYNDYFGRKDKHAEFKHYVIDEISGKLVIPNGTMGDRWDRQDKWNLREENSNTGEEIRPKLSILKERDGVVEVPFPYFGNDRGNNPMISRAVPVKKIKTANGVKLVTTVYDLTLANYGIDTGLGGECANSYEEDTPYTPKWQEKFTGVSADMVIHTAREFADNALKTNGRTMVIMGGGINHWFHADVIYRTILNLLMMCGCEGRNGCCWAHYVGQEKLRPIEGWARVMTGTDWQGGASRLVAGLSFLQQERTENFRRGKGGRL